MTDPAKSLHDLTPLDPDAKGDDKPQDVGNHQTPKLKVWDRRPSFNLDPPPIPQDQGNKAPTGENSDVEPFAIDLGTVADEVKYMLSTSRGLVSEYEELKAKVKATEGDVFGQHAITSSRTDKETGAYMPPNQGANAANDFIHGDKHFPTDFADKAKEFATQMNPVQEKALQQIGMALELVGEYIAMVNVAGQTYGKSDRKSKFPDPPPSSA